MRNTLILNADGMPLSVVPLSTVSWQDAIQKMFKDYATTTVIEEYENWVIHSPTIAVHVPAIMMLSDYVEKSRSIKFSRTNIFIRDGYKCQYCGMDGFNQRSSLTFDHVIPRYHGGRTKWDNIVTSCQKCNMEKAHYYNMKPKTNPWKPTYFELASKARSLPIVIPHESWIDYIGWDRSLITIKSHKY